MALYKQSIMFIAQRFQPSSIECIIFMQSQSLDDGHLSKSDLHSGDGYPMFHIDGMVHDYSLQRR